MQHANDNTFQAVRWSDKRRTHLAKQTKNSVLLYTEFWLTPWGPADVCNRVVFRSDRRDYQLNRIYNKILDRDWSAVRLFVMVIGSSGVQFRE